MDPILKLENVSKSYGSTLILSDLNLEVHQGERFFILGPSGCGKTTLLRIIAGLDTEHEGKLEIMGRKAAGDGTPTPPHKRAVGFVFQDGALWPHMRIEKHLTYAPGAKSRKEWIEYLLELTGLADRRKDYPAALSGGERQRLALARALAPQPALLLLDEPLRNLDRNLALEFREAMVRILKETDSTAIFVTHDQEEALSMAHRMLLMNRYGPVQTGTPEEIYKHPQTPWAATFFGSTDRFSAICESGGTLHTPLGTFHSDHPPGTPCEVIFRTSQVTANLEGRSIAATLKRQSFQGDEFVMICEVEGRELMACSKTPVPGSETRIHLEVKGGPMVFVINPSEVMI